MTITRVWQSGFEHNEVTVTVHPYEFDSNQWGNEQPVVAPIAGGVGGAYHLRISALGANARAWTGFVHTGALSQFRTGFHIRHNGLLSGISTCNIASAKTLGGSFRIIFYFDMNTNLIHIYKDSVYYGISSIPMVANIWHHVVLDVKLDGAAGWMDLWVNGNLALQLAGNTGATAIEAIGLGSYPNALSANQVIQQLDYDNFYIDNMAAEARGQAPPIYYYKALLPNADGNYSSWVGSDGNQANNYLLVDEVPPNEDTDYVFASGTAIKDSYGVGAYTPTVGTLISSIIPTAIARKTGSENVLLGLGTRLGGVDVISTGTSVPATSYSSKFFFGRQTTKPGGGVWESADVEDVEIIIESGGTYA